MPHIQPNLDEQLTRRPAILAQLNSALSASRVHQDQRGSELYIKCKNLLARRNAKLVAHYYVDANLQTLAEESGGFVGDSLQMAQFGARAASDEIIVAGVRFMGETAKILSPHKTVRVIDRHAECSLDLACQADVFGEFCAGHPDHQVVVYANTSARVKAMADWVVTSSIALELIDHLAGEDIPIIWAPDKHLGHYLQQQTSARMLLWDGACVVHEEFKAEAITRMRRLNPQAGVLAHPESPQAVLDIADAVGSTSQLIAQAAQLPHPAFIVATDGGILHKMQQAVPHKILYLAPTQGKGATCKSCAHCPWMGLNDLQRLHQLLVQDTNQVVLDARTIAAARRPLERMLAFARSLQPTTPPARQPGPSTRPGVARAQHV